MKKLFFLFGFVLFLGLSASAQEYLSTDDAIVALKETVAKGENAISMTADVSNDAAILSFAKNRALKGYLGQLNSNENTSALLEEYFGGFASNGRLSDAVVAEAKSYIKGLVTKPE